MHNSWDYFNLRQREIKRKVEVHENTGAKDVSAETRVLDTMVTLWLLLIKYTTL